MVKYFFFFLFSINLFAQEISIPTTFYQDGKLYKNLNENLNELSNPIIEFSENEKCMVIGYLGRDNYKIVYKEKEGIVTVDDLEVNEEMTDLYYKYQEKQRLKAVEIRENRKQRLDEIANKDAEEKALKEQKVRDSITRIVAAKKAIVEKQKRDSIARVIAEQKVLKEEKTRDSIVKSVAVQKVIREKQKRDSIARVVSEQKVLKEQMAKDAISENIAAQQAIEDKTVIVSTLVSDEEKKLEKERLEQLKFKETCHYTINEFDSFYNIKTVRTKAYKLAENLTVELYKQGRKINIFFNAKADLGCVSYFSSNKSSVKVTLENNQTISFYHSWDMECGEFLFKGNLSKSKMEILKKSPIKSIRLKATRWAMDITIIEYKAFFIDKLKCIEE